VGFGHRMLWTTPESLAEKLPKTDSVLGLAITADARLDNRDALMAILDVDENTIADTDLILRAYDRWGESCPTKLLGDFSFAIWDFQKRLLFCARDPLGVKPFYYYHQPGKIFAFASEIKGLLCLPQVARRLNEEKVGDYLLAMLDDKIFTFFANILRLPPSSSLVISSEEMRIKTYWALNISNESPSQSDNEYAETFRSLFIQAVHSRMRSAFSVGSLLSGGLDSSSITCTARDYLRSKEEKKLKTFSAIFPEVPECDERPFMNTVIDQGGIQPFFVPGDAVGPLHDLDNVFWHQDEPFFTPNLFIHSTLYSAARNQGVRVLLDGFDGDTTVSHGLGRLPELFRACRWLSLIREINGLSKNFNSSRWKYTRMAASPFIPSSIRKILRMVRDHNDPVRIQSEFAKRIGLNERIFTYEKQHLQPVNTQKAEHYRRLSWGLISFVLQVADRAASSYGIDARYPFFDRRLVEFCLSLPSNQKLHNGFTRIVLRRALNNILPNKVQWRGDKARLGQNFRRGLLLFGRNQLDDILLCNSSVLEDYVDINLIGEAYRRFSSGLGSNDDALAVWRVASLGLWLRWAKF
jgi:asparagine synthase (glutamine-hydrolysing)